MDFKEYEKKATGLKDEYQKEAYDNYEKHVGPIDNTKHRHNDDVDAYRHAYVAAKLTQLMAGTQWASEIILDAHEVSSENAPYEHRMDGWNNEVGRRFGDEYSSEELGKKLADELKEDGLLVTSPSDVRLETLYSNDPKLKDPNLLDREKDGQWGVTEEAMDKITDDASSEIDKLMETREKELNTVSKEALPTGTVVNDKDIGLDTYDSTTKAQEIVNNVYTPQENHNNNNDYGMEIGD